ncbi:hypothetical protein EDB86DRAFT_3246016 [Lactarius hatsudake]|nr:hypothetical protein EDB86DRAFT_3246016 [Lactarius hatsudake]
MQQLEPHIRIPEFRKNVRPITSLRDNGQPHFYRIFRAKEKVKLDPSIDVGDNNTSLFMIGEHELVIDPVLNNSCSPIMKVMFFMTLAELSQEARKNSGFCNNSFDTSAEKRDWQTNHIALFAITKTDVHLLSDIHIHVEDFGSPDGSVFDVADKQFREHYLRPFGDARYVQLESAQANMGCDEFIETTAAVLNDDIVASMLLAVQRDKLFECSNSFVLPVNAPLEGASSRNSSQKLKWRI